MVIFIRTRYSSQYYGLRRRQQITYAALLYVSKNVSFLFFEQLRENQPILMIFGTQHPEETRHQSVINLFTSPTNCCRTTLGSAKIIFQQYSTVISTNKLFNNRIGVFDRPFPLSRGDAVNSAALPRCL